MCVFIYSCARVSYDNEYLKREGCGFWFLCTQEDHVS